MAITIMNIVHRTLQLQERTSGAILEIGLWVGVIPQNIIPRHVLLTIFDSFYQRRVLNPLQGALSAVFYTNLRLIHHVILV